MRLFKAMFRGISIESQPVLANRSLTGRSMLLGIPLLAAILLVVFLIAGNGAQKFVDHAITRNAQLQAQTIGFALEHILLETRNQLLLLAAGSIEQELMFRDLKQRAQTSGSTYREIAFMGLEPDDRYLFINNGREVLPVAYEVAKNAPGSPFQGMPGSDEGGFVNIGRPVEVSYPLMALKDTHQTVTFQVLRFSTPIHDAEGNFRGILVLSLDLSALRNRLSQIPGTSIASPDNQSWRSFFFDHEGWMMFQSEHDAASKPLSSDVVRAGFKGDFGRPGFSLAFRPSPEHLNYWTMVSEVQAQRSGMISLPVSYSPDAAAPLRSSVSYAPVTFQQSDTLPPQLVGGIAFIDEDFMESTSGKKIFGVFIAAFFTGLVLLALCLWLVTKNVGRHLEQFACELRKLNASALARPLRLPPLPREMDNLRNEVNILLQRLRTALTAQNDHTAEQSRRRLCAPVSTLPPVAVKHASFFVGDSPAMHTLYQQIEKAARINADVLVVGETGTGKELVAESIHTLSDRSGGPFISINCGALDEALLMDTLFGHVRGAFTEAKTDRKGAFLSANGGTLLLDEIGNAPLKVQKALLRALSTRRIKPLGSDQDIPFNTRIIAATNANIGTGNEDFRNDLYYRLAVITIETPPLRDRKDDIPALIVHFMALHATECGRDGIIPGISHGALEMLESYDWPGNVRELKNVMTNAMTFCDGKLIQGADLRITASPPFGESSAWPRVLPQETIRGTWPTEILDRLNQRQKAVWTELAAMSSISRQDYQQLAGTGISARTAQYDLKYMLELGLLRREGSGPGSRYVPMPTPGMHKGQSEASYESS